jgi:hypothetical protein
MADENREPFLARWSRLKKAEAARPLPAAASQPAPPSEADPREAGPAAAAPATSDVSAAPSEEAVRLEDLPRLDDLTADSDISIFLRKGVPEELRNLALRRAWSLDPAIRDFVEVAENQYDWNAPGGVPGFGELDPSFDLEKLLAQATGQLPGPGQLPQELARQNDATDPPTLEDSAVQQPAAHAAISHPPREAAPSEGPDEQAGPPSPGRRRHGGALPG